MARSPRRRRIPANLQCNVCGHQFVARAWYVSIETKNRGTIGWVQDSTNGARCPSCGSALTRACLTIHEDSHIISEAMTTIAR